MDTQTPSSQPAQLETAEAIDERHKFRPKRNKKEREDDLVLIAELTAKGWEQREIADHLCSIRGYTLSREQIRYDQKEVVQRWQQEHSGRLADLKEVELRRLDLQEREAWQGWEKSRQPRRVMRQSKMNGSGEISTSATQEARPGNPKFMFLIIRLRNQRIRLLGLDQPSAAPPPSPPRENAARLRQVYREVIAAEVKAELMAAQPHGNGAG